VSGSFRHSGLLLWYLRILLQRITPSDDSCSSRGRYLTQVTLFKFGYCASAKWYFNPCKLKLGQNNTCFSKPFTFHTEFQSVGECALKLVLLITLGGAALDQILFTASTIIVFQHIRSGKQRKTMSVRSYLG
jgi:hypothetical protein